MKKGPLLWLAVCVLNVECFRRIRLENNFPEAKVAHQTLFYTNVRYFYSLLIESFVVAKTSICLIGILLVCVLLFVPQLDLLK